MAKTCKPGYYWCYTDKKCKKIPVGWHVGRGGMIEKDDEETKKNNENGESSEGNGESGGAVTEDLRKWFGTGKKGGVGGGGWDRYNTKGEREGKCAREPGEPKPKCLSKEKAAKMTKDEIAAAVKRKRKKDPVADRPGKGGKPKMVSNNIDEGLKQARKNVGAAKCWPGKVAKGTKIKNGKEVPNCVPESTMPAAIDPKKHREQQRAAKIRTLAQKGSTEGERAAAEKKTKGPKMFGEDLKLVDKILLEMEAEVLNEKNVPTNPSLWSKMKAKAKAKFDVYPSAYANGWAAKEYKKAGGGWKSVSEETAQVRYCPKCEKDETREECAYGPRYWDTFSLPSSLKTTFESVDPGEDGGVCPHCGCDPCECEGNEISEATRIQAKTGNLMYVMSTWRGKNYSLKIFFPQAKRPTRSEVQAEIEKVYPGAKVRWMEVIQLKPGEQFLQVSEGAAWTKKSGKNPEGGLNEKGRKSYERENPGSDLKAPSKKVGNKRRASFCARMKGMKKKLTSAKTANDPDSRINKSLRAWNC